MGNDLVVLVLADEYELRASSKSIANELWKFPEHGPGSADVERENERTNYITIIIIVFITCHNWNVWNIIEPPCMPTTFGTLDRPDDYSNNQSCLKLNRTEQSDEDVLVVLCLLASPLLQPCTDWLLFSAIRSIRVGSRMNTHQAGDELRARGVRTWTRFSFWPQRERSKHHRRRSTYVLAGLPR